MKGNEIPTENDSQRPPGQFLLGQLVWRAEAPAKKRWDLAIREDEPTDEASKGDPAFRPAPVIDETGEEELVESKGDLPSQRWLRLDKREELIGYATSDDSAWRHVGVVCGAGLGKTTNLQWLEAAVNRLHDGRGKHLAIFLEIRDLSDLQDKILDYVVQRIANKVGGRDLLRFAAERMLLDGRVTWLLDSLDQADPDPKGPVVAAVRELIQGRWSRCRVWVSGRPYAFRIARPGLEAIAPQSPWQFIRIGQLDEPECRQLLETSRRPDAQ